LQKKVVIIFLWNCRTRNKEESNKEAEKKSTRYKWRSTYHEQCNL